MKKHQLDATKKRSFFDNLSSFKMGTMNSAPTNKQKMVYRVTISVCVVYISFPRIEAR